MDPGDRSRGVGDDRLALRSVIPPSNSGRNYSCRRPPHRSTPVVRCLRDPCTECLCGTLESRSEAAHAHRLSRPSAARCAASPARFRPGVSREVTCSHERIARTKPDFMYRGGHAGRIGRYDALVHADGPRDECARCTPSYREPEPELTCDGQFASGLLPTTQALGSNPQARPQNDNTSELRILIMDLCYHCGGRRLGRLDGALGRNASLRTR
jgi:hypothetical protein